MVIFDAVVLAGGRSSRLGGQPKAGLILDGESLLQRAVAATSGCRAVVVVGERAAGTIFACDDPPFGGPAAGLAAGMRALELGGADRRDTTCAGGGSGATTAELTLVLACDVPHAADAVDALLAHRSRIGKGALDGVVAVDPDGRRQPLLALYSTSALRTAVDRTDLHGLSMRGLLAGLRLDDIEVPAGSTDDVDTWDDATRLGVSPPTTSLPTTPPPTAQPA